MEKKTKRAVVLIDGVHKADNSINGIRQLAEELDFTPVRLVWIGGTEKMKDQESFRREFEEVFPVEVIFEGDVDTGAADPVSGLHRALGKRDIDMVVQLSGSPQVNRRLMNRFASVAVGYGASYVAGGTVFAEYSKDAEAQKPSVGLYATDKRVGKTAFGVYVAALISGLRNIQTPWSSITLTHSRGGPPAPPVLAIYKNPLDRKKAEEMTLDELYGRRFQPDFLERLLNFGLHGASDVYEDALILSEYLNAFEASGRKSEVPKMYIVGCRRAGAGYFHEFAVSNVDLGIESANKCSGDFILHEGSGGEHPPVKVDGTITLVPADADEGLLADFPGLDTTDLVILAHCQPETASLSRIASLEKVIRERCRETPILRTFFEPEVIGDPEALNTGVKGKRVALFTTAPKIVEKKLAEALVRSWDVEVQRVCFTLTRNKAMQEDIDSLMSSSSPPDVFLMEIKARGVEGAKYIRDKYHKPVFYVNNIPCQVDDAGDRKPDNSDLDRTIAEALNKAVERFNTRKKASFPLCPL
ncbi:MAG TPA: hypothetical protein VM123_04615 [archaeon]|nr:hypothetical protein [archaeon]